MIERRAAVIGGGPAGLMAAETLAEGGVGVDLYEAMPTVGRKLLMAGRGGLNLTHDEPAEQFLARYGDAAPHLAPALAAFGPADLRAWARGLGIDTFVGSSGRVFPVGLKASPLLRAWLARLRGQGVQFHVRHRWTGFTDDGGLRFDTPDGAVEAHPDATVLALGGASWKRLGTDGAWASILAGAGVKLTPFRPANCGFLVDWSPVFRDRWAGSPLKTITLEFEGRTVPGEAMITATGIEGGAVYALSAVLRDAIERDGSAGLMIDLKPGFSEAQLAERLIMPRRGASSGNFLRKTTGLSPVAVALLREVCGDVMLADPNRLARAVKCLQLSLTGTAPIDRAISTAGGVAWDAVNEFLALRMGSGVFVAGEMLDWEAPTGGYLLQACFAGGRMAGQGVLAHHSR